MRMMPTLSSGDSGSRFATLQPTSGMTAYWLRTPRMTGFGWRAIIVKSGMDRVIPIPSIVTASNGVM